MKSPHGNTHDPGPPAWPVHADLTRTIRISGSRWGFLTALATIIIWVAAGPFFRDSEGWQLVIHTGTTIVTFLMVFLDQNPAGVSGHAATWHPFSLNLPDLPTEVPGHSVHGPGRATGKETKTEKRLNYEHFM